jgi:hypothetical protein
MYDRFYLFAFPRYKAYLRRRYRRQALRRPNPDTAKVDAVYKCLEVSLVGWQGLEATYDCAKKVLVDKIPGDLVECGVAQGGSALLIALVNRDVGGGSRRIWLFDSFEGLPEPTKKDYEGGRTGSHIRPLPKGSCLGTIEDVSRLLFVENGFGPDGVRLVKGWFQETLPIEGAKIGPIALLRLDGDWYESTLVCLNHLFDSVTEGGFVILDDYFTCFGCKKATDEFLSARGKAYPIVSDGRGGAFFEKRG